MVDIATSGLIVQHGFKLDGGGHAGQVVDIYKESEIQERPIGSRATHEQTGRTFRYGQAGAAITAGHIVGPDLSDHALADTDNAVDATGELDPGTRTVLVDNSAFNSVTEDKYAGGLFQGTGGTGIGVQYLIKENTATRNSDEVTFTMHDGKVVRLAATTDFAIVPPLWRELRAATLATDFMVTGQAPIAFTDGYFGWFQTWGPAVCISDGATAGGHPLYLSDGSAGEVNDVGGGGTSVADIDTPYVGDALYAGDNDGGIGVVLKIYP